MGICALSCNHKLFLSSYRFKLYICGVSWITYTLILSAFFVYLLRTGNKLLPGVKTWITATLFLIKILASFAVWGVYTYYYADRQYADIWKYFDDSKIIAAALPDQPSDYFKMVTGFGNQEDLDERYYTRMNHWHQKFENNLFNDSHTIIRYNALLKPISGGNYHIHSLVMCILGFIGCTALFRFFLHFLPEWKNALLVLLFLLPSFVFWTSGVLKEGLMFLALGIIFEQLFISQRHGLLRLVLIFTAAVILAMTKLYLLLILFIPLVVFVIAQRMQRNSAILWLSGIGICILIVGGLHFAKSTYDPFRLLINKHNDFLNLSIGGTFMYNDSAVVYVDADHHSAIQYTQPGTCRITGPTPTLYWLHAKGFDDTLKTTHTNDTVSYTIMTDYPRAGSLLHEQPLHSATDVLLSIPAALNNATMRPYPWEPRSALLIPSAAENLLLYLTLIAALLYRNKTTSDLFFFLCWFSITYLIVAGLTTPVLGALVRYKITAVPFLFSALFMLIDTEQLPARIRRLLTV